MSITFMRGNDDPASVPTDTPGAVAHAGLRVQARDAQGTAHHADAGGPRWVIAVLDDLRQYAQAAGIGHTARARASARDIASAEIARMKC